MKNASKKVIISALVLVVAIAMALTSTYAWFTLNTTPEVGGVNLGATTDDGLYVSLTGAPGTFRSKLSTGDILFGMLTKANTAKKFTDDNESIYDATATLMSATSDYNFDSITDADISAAFANITTVDTTIVKPTTNTLLLDALQKVFTNVYNKLDTVTYNRTPDSLYELLDASNKSKEFEGDNKIIFDATVTLMTSTKFSKLEDTAIAAAFVSTSLTTKPTDKASLLTALEGIATSLKIESKFQKLTGVGADGAATLTDIAGTEGMFALDLFFMSTNKFDVYVTDATTAAVGTLKEQVYSWEEIVANTYGTHTAIAKGAALSTRAAYAARFKVGSAIINPDQGTNGYYKGNMALDYFNAITNNIALVLPTDAATYLAGTQKTAVGFNGATAPITPNAYATGIKVATAGTDTVGGDNTFVSGITPTTINIWLEGWDGDCFNAILSDSFNFTLKFAGNRITA